MNRLHRYFCARKGPALALLWLSFAAAMGYMLLCLLAFPDWPFWLCLVPGALCLYFRIAYAEAAYDPTRDRFSERYVPRDLRGG